jgi:CysZ protein
MIDALARAAGALAMPALRRIVALALGLAAATLALLWLGVGALLYNASFFAWRPLNWLVELLGGAAVVALTWLLFPAVVTLVMGFFLDRVAATVEALEYPGKGPPRRQSWWQIAAAATRLAAITVVLNLLALPLYLLVPGINFVLFWGLNGYLFGRGYFEVAALRRLDAAAARGMRQRFAGRIFVAGVVITGLFALPLVNLVAPVIATAFMVHLFEALPRSAPPLPAQSAH